MEAPVLEGTVAATTSRPRRVPRDWNVSAFLAPVKTLVAVRGGGDFHAAFVSGGSVIFCDVTSSGSQKWGKGEKAPEALEVLGCSIHSHSSQKDPDHTKPPAGLSWAPPACLGREKRIRLRSRWTQTTFTARQRKTPPWCWQVAHMSPPLLASFCFFFGDESVHTGGHLCLFLR